MDAIWHMERLTLRLLAPDGTERWRRELDVRPRPVPDAEHDSIVDDAHARVGRLGESLLGYGLSPGGVPAVPSATEARSILYLPAYRPHVRAIRIGVDGTIWLELSETADGATWLALDPATGPLLTITLPPGVSFGQATRSGVWYSELDDIGVPWVVHALFAPASE
jgi:hypothetical protein